MRWLQLAAILLLGCVTLNSYAIVNVENMRVGTEEQGLSGSLDLTISGKRGNTQQNVYGVAGRLQRHRDNVTNFVVLSYDYGEVNYQLNTNKSFMHARHIVQYSPSRAWEAFVQAESNEFTRLSFRGLVGGDLRFTLAEEPERRGLYLGTGAFWSREILEPRPGLTDQGQQNMVRGSFYLSYKEKLNDQVSFVTTLYYQPRISDVGDYRIFEQAAMAVKMSDTLALKLSLDIAHDSQPPQTVEQTDTTYITTLSYSF